MTISINPQDFVDAAPLLFATFWACLIVFAVAMASASRVSLGRFSVIGYALTLGLSCYSWANHQQPSLIFNGMLSVDRFSIFIDGAILVVAMLSALASDSYAKKNRGIQGEFFAVQALAVVGMMLMVHSTDFITMLIGLETMSLGIYCLVAARHDEARSAEGALKYFVMGAVASAFLLYGVAFIYGATGSTNFSMIASSAHKGEPLFRVGMLLIFSAMAFKVALVPFHMWSPDAYEAAPTPISGLMSAGVKAAGFAVLLRLAATLFADPQLSYGDQGWLNVIYNLAIASMIVGNITALRQQNVKRMLAYSSVGHAGFMLIAVLVSMMSSQSGVEYSAAPLLFYLVCYGLSSLGAFAVVGWLGQQDRERERLDQWAGLAQKHPGAAFAMAIFLLSLAGIPPTAGFFAKFSILKDAMQFDSMRPIVIIAVVNSMISIFYYLKPIVALYFRPALREDDGVIESNSVKVAVSVAALLVLLVGLLPSHLWNLAQQALLILR